MFTMRPQPFLFMPGNASRVVWKAALRLIARIAFHLSTGNSSTGATCWMPALLTTMSTAPNRPIAELIIASMLSGLVMSAPSCCTSTRCFSARRARKRSISERSPNPLRTMFAPCLANASAMPRPMPLVEPVTSAVLPFIMGTSGRVNAFMVAQSCPALQFGKITMIRFSQVSLIRGTKLLLEGADVALNPGERIGLIGANGSGKSCLFALLRGELHTDKGELDYPALWRVAHVTQETLALDRPAVEYAIDGDSASRSRAERLLTGLGFTVHEHGLPVSSFSGGWRMRLNLAQALMCPSDLLLLDEPTNHLDLD